MSEEEKRKPGRPKKQELPFPEKEQTSVVEIEKLAQEKAEETTAILPEPDLDEQEPANNEVGEKPESTQVVNGWLEITDAQKNGDQLVVSEQPKGDGVLAFWRKTRKMEHFKWIESGKWSDTISHQTLAFEAKYYKAKNA
jgi:hypothetical protein